MKKLPPLIFLYGGTGQSKVIRPVIEYYGSRVLAVFDDTEGLAPPFKDVPLFKGACIEEWLTSQNRHEIGFCIAIGNPHGRVRLKLHERFVNEGLKPVTIIHPTAWVADNAEIGDGTQILAGAIVAAEARIGRQCIINNNAVVEHEVILEDAVEIATSATVLGLTMIGTNTLVGTNAVVLSRLKIGIDVIISAGSVVDSNIADKTVVRGPSGRSH